MPNPQALRLAIGLGIPFLAIVPTIPLLDRLDVVWLGVPLPVLWLFGCIPLTSACLAACWFLFDRHLPDDAQDLDRARCGDEAGTARGSRVQGREDGP